MLAPCGVRGAAGDGQQPAAGGLVRPMPRQAVSVIASHMCNRVPRAEDQCRCPSLVGGAELLLWHIGQHWLAPDCCCGVYLCHTAAGKDPKKGSESACPAGLPPVGETLGPIPHWRGLQDKGLGSSRAGPGGLRSILGSVPVVQP